MILEILLCILVLVLILEWDMATTIGAVNGVAEASIANVNGVAKSVHKIYGIAFPAEAAPGSYFYADFEESDGSDGLSLFDSIIASTGGSASSLVERSSDWASHESYGMKHKTTGQANNIVCIKTIGTGGSSNFAIKIRWRHKASSTHRVGVCYGGNTGGDGDYEGGILLWYKDSGNDVFLSTFDTDGTPIDWASTDSDLNIGALTDGNKYTLVLTITKSGGTSTITGKMYNASDTEIASVGGSLSDPATDQVAFLTYHNTSTDGDVVVVDECEVVVND